MTGMGRLPTGGIPRLVTKEETVMGFLPQRRFFSVILALFFMGCHPTIFVTDEIEAKAAAGASLIVVPVHREYLVGSEFAKTEDHFSVYLVYPGGITQKLSLDMVKVTLGEDPITEEPYFLDVLGEHEVTVIYEDLSASYFIIVRNSVGTPDGITPDTSGATSIDIDLKWI
jgi:hypothetical protein